MRTRDRVGRGDDPAEREGKELSQSSDAGTITDPRRHFHALTRDEQSAAILRMADHGHSDYTIAAATALSVEMVRQVLGAGDCAETPPEAR